MRTFHHHVEKEKYLLVILQSVEKIEDCILTITILPPLEIPIQSNSFRSVLHLILAENKDLRADLLNQYFIFWILIFEILLRTYFVLSTLSTNFCKKGCSHLRKANQKAYLDDWRVELLYMYCSQSVVLVLFLIFMALWFYYRFMLSIAFCSNDFFFSPV